MSPYDKVRARQTNRQRDVPSSFHFAVSPVFPSNMAKVNGRACKLSGFRLTAQLSSTEIGSLCLCASFLGRGAARELGESSLGLRLAERCLLPHVTVTLKSRELLSSRGNPNQLWKTLRHIKLGLLGEKKNQIVISHRITQQTKQENK